MKLGRFLNTRWVYRAWYYFRLGYSTYLSFLLGFVSTLVTVYYLAIKNAPDLLNLFPHFAPFAVLATIIGVPLGVMVGWIHLKRSGLYTRESEVVVESYPFTYKLPPGVVKEAQGPATLIQLTLLRKLSEASGVLTESERAEISELERKWRTLNEGGYVGSPRKKID